MAGWPLVNEPDSWLRESADYTASAAEDMQVTTVSSTSRGSFFTRLLH